MSKTMGNRIFAILTLIFTVGCKKPYTPEVIAAPNSYLVVEGMIKSGSDSTIIKLNRTVNISGANSVNPELGATVSVESDANESIPLVEKPNGVYIFPALNLNNAHRYRLKIKTSRGKEYVSDFAPVLISPPIDSLTYRVQSDGVSINVNTHDAAIKYYRWEYDETWVFTSDFQSTQKSNGDTVLARDMFNDQIYTCWRGDLSSTIVLGSSAKLSQNIISDAPVTFISRHSAKIRHRYSALVRQYPLTKDAYDFWVNLKKNTEQLGSIFDAQPSQINGNIHAVADTSEPVIGYVSIGTISKKRIFVDQSALPAWIDPNNDGCKVEDFLFVYKDPANGAIVNQADQYINYNKATRELRIPLSGLYFPGDPVLHGYHAALPECVDCTLHGTNKQPDFWIP
jgi:hypothetical protein